MVVSERVLVGARVLVFVVAWVFSPATRSHLARVFAHPVGAVLALHSGEREGDVK